MKPVYVLKPKNDTEANFINQLIKKLGIDFDKIDSTVHEDFLFGKILNAEKTEKLVDESTIMKKLKK